MSPPHGLGGFSAWPAQARDVPSPSQCFSKESESHKPTECPHKAWVGFPPGPLKPGTFFATIEANRMSPRGLGALFRLGAPEPGHSFQSEFDAPPMSRFSNLEHRAAGQDMNCIVWSGACHTGTAIKNHHSSQPNAHSRLGRVFRLARPSQGILLTRWRERSQFCVISIRIHRSQKDAPYGLGGFSA
jgi:hypothetical protein